MQSGSVRSSLAAFMGGNLYMQVTSADVVVAAMLFLGKEDIVRSNWDLILSLPYDLNFIELI